MSNQIIKNMNMQYSTFFVTHEGYHESSYQPFKFDWKVGYQKTYDLWNSKNS